jgi:putative ABC transport system ATP-binding protein
VTATHQAKKQRFAPKATILRQGEAVEHFFMIVAGEVEIVVDNAQSKEMSLACLSPGQFFGEVELTQEGDSITSVRAAKHGAAVALLPRDTFYRLIDGSPLTRSDLQDVAETRLAENRRRNTDR